LLETFLHQIFGFGWDEVHAEAEVLEHHLSERLTDAMDRFLKYPTADPHGEVIPAKDGKLLPVAQTRLSDVAEGRTAQVVWVHPHQNEMLKHLDTLGIGVQTRILVKQKAPFDGPLHLKIDHAGKKRTCMLGHAVADHIYVELVD
jgi:DtxR family Mn-dependent transcriptional regulator